MCWLWKKNTTGLFDEGFHFLVEGFHFIVEDFHFILFT